MRNPYTAPFVLPAGGRPRDFVSPDTMICAGRPSLRQAAAHVPERIKTLRELLCLINQLF
jgi:hypothetical protein